ncbi:MAG: deoxyribodipyrimidine photo-lyase, partial [Henriciella sp.]
MTTRPNILWFRNDLRLFDNPALTAATQDAAPLICVYILETRHTDRDLGGARKWWLHKSLIALQTSIEARGGRLVLRRGDAADILAELANDTGAAGIFWNRRYDKAGRSIDAQIKTDLSNNGLAVSSYSANVLVEPWRLTTGSGSYY